MRTDKCIHNYSARHIIAPILYKLKVKVKDVAIAQVCKLEMTFVDKYLLIKLYQLFYSINFRSECMCLVIDLYELIHIIFITNVNAATREVVVC